MKVPIISTLIAVAALSLCSAMSAQDVPATGSTASPTAGAAASPPAAQPSVLLDTYGDNVGIAQASAHNRGLQGRILWIDAGANVGNLNSVEKINDVVSKAKAAGFNMIVLDVKPIVGDTIYPSVYAPRLTEWKGQTVSPDLDVLRTVLDSAHAAGLSVYANTSTFGEGHKYVHRGLAYTHPTWQTVLYEADRSVSGGGPSIEIPFTNDLPTQDDALAAVTDSGMLAKSRPGYTVAILNLDARVIMVQDGNTLLDYPPHIPPRGSALIGRGRGGDWLRQFAQVGNILTFSASPRYVPIVAAPEQKYTMFCNPLNPELRRHEWDIVREIVTRYPVDGVVFDDRLRYAAVNADFSESSRAAFEAIVGHPLRWPDDVFRTSPYPGQGNIPGPYYQRWLDWRAGVVKSWVDTAADIVHSVRPGAQVAVYVGSWYGDYEKVGSNWAGPDFSAPYRWLTPDYRRTAFARDLDWITTGCYYEQATLDQAHSEGGSPGATVEGAGQISNLAVSDSAWTYAGLYALSYAGDPDAFQRAIAAATASTQGVMIFDMSQIIDYNWWDVIRAAFDGATPQAPNTVPGLLQTVRTAHDSARAAGLAPPPLPPFVGEEDTGF